MTQTEALRLALEALSTSMYPQPRQLNAIAAIKSALEAKDEPWEKFCDSHCVWTDHHPDCKLANDEPVGYFSVNDYGNWEENESNNGIHLYTTPPQRKPLTDEQVDAIWPLHTFIQAPDRQWLAFARAIEAAHGIKGEA